MKGTSNAPLKVAIHGMDGRSYKMMVMFLQGPCKGSAAVVNDEEAQVDIIDADVKNAKTLIEKRKKLNPERPLIVLSLQARSSDDIIFVQKPIQTESMRAALKKARQILEVSKKKAALKQHYASVVRSNREKPDNAAGPRMVTRVHRQSPDEKTEPEKKVFINTDEQKKTSKHQTAIHLDEKGFSAFIGLVSGAGVDYNDPAAIKAASYNAKQYYQGYVQSAFKLAQAKKRIVQLNSGWRPLVIFPMTREIWVDADDKQLRAFSSVPINTISGAKSITVTPFDPKKHNLSSDLDKFQSMEAFIWKLAIWTSKGRYPEGIDIERPVYLKRWPNFTRLMISPHSLRITALLMDGPRSLINITQVLNIKPQYVFAFFSAAYATGLAGQAERKADVMIAPSKPKPSKKKGLLTHIMRKLRGK